MREARGTYTSAELTVPGLAIMGGESAITRAFGAPEPRPNLRVELVPRAGHFLVDESPQEILALLKPFLGVGIAVDSARASLLSLIPPGC